MSTINRGVAGLARRLRLRTVAVAGAAALALAVTGTADAQALGPKVGSTAAANTVVQPHASTFKGFEGVFVATDGHIRNIDPNGTLENHGPSLALNGTDSVAIHNTHDGGFNELFRSDEGSGLMFFGNNNGFHLFEPDHLHSVDPNSTPAIGGDRNTGSTLNAWSENHQLMVLRDGFNNELPFQEGPIQGNTSPAAAGTTGVGNGFVLAWVGVDNMLTIDDGAGVQTIQPANLRVKPFTSPAVAATSNGQNWGVLWQDVSGHLAFAANVPGKTMFGAGETTETLIGSPSLVTLSNGAFFHATEGTNGHVFLNGVDTGHEVELGNDPAIAADGSGGWRVLYADPNLFMHTFDNHGNQQVFTTARPATDARPALVGLFSG